MLACPRQLPATTKPQRHYRRSSNTALWLLYCFSAARGGVFGSEESEARHAPRSRQGTGESDVNGPRGAPFLGLMRVGETLSTGQLIRSRRLMHVCLRRRKSRVSLASGNLERLQLAERRSHQLSADRQTVTLRHNYYDYHRLDFNEMSECFQEGGVRRSR